MVSAESFLVNMRSVVSKLEQTQMPAIQRIAAELAKRIQSGSNVYLFGTGHSKVFAMEMCNRAGGLLPMHMIAVDELQRRGIHCTSDLEDPSIERDPDTAHQLLNCYPIRPEDTAIIISNSGRNGAVVEMAILLKERGLTVFCVTSLTHAQSVSSRHPSGKMLHEVADDVIDNCGPCGDTLMWDERIGTKVCSTSSLTSVVIAQCLTAEIANHLLASGEPVPILKSSNSDGADGWNRRIRN